MITLRKIEVHMARDNAGRVRLLEILPGTRTLHCFRLELGGEQDTAVMPGQYCLLGEHTPTLPCSYLSLPGIARQFIVATQRSTLLGKVGDWLHYSGPLGTAWPVPLLSARLLLISHAEGLLSLLCVLDEIMCWLPWVQIQLLHDGFNISHLPEECRPWFTPEPSLHRNLFILPSSAGLARQLEAYRPDTVYCCAPMQLALQTARVCQQKGIAIQRIWLRTDYLSCPARGWQPPLQGPVLRLDSVSSPPPSG
ncbi:hypothetical protein [Pseudomonas putida]|uniref:hypothetical protein n=1 Tax=Pseudomonas putida TaxID=303 RepID=UPI0024E07708|nr:hypothetical protein [Pseudomonas putida]